MYSHNFLVAIFGLVTAFGGPYKIVKINGGTSHKPGHQYTYSITTECEVLATVEDIENCWLCELETPFKDKVYVKLNIEQHDDYVLAKVYSVNFRDLYKHYTFRGTDYDEFLRLKLGMS